MSTAAGLERAFSLYRDLCSSLPLADDGAVGAVLELLLPYVHSVVRGKGAFRCHADYEDAVSDVCLALLITLKARGFPSAEFDSFRGALRTKVVQGLTWRGLHEEKRSQAEAHAAVLGVDAEDDPVFDSVMLTDGIANSREWLIQVMLDRSRIGAITSELCGKVVDWMVGSEGGKLPLETELGRQPFWDRYFLANYLQALYRWSWHDLRRDLMAS